MDDDLLVLEVASADDPDGEKLREALEAHFEVARLRALATFLLYGLVGFSVPLWLSASWPRLLPLGLRSLCVLMWPCCAAGSVVAQLSALSWRRRELASGGRSAARPRTVSS
jgi:hypothetical protein